MLVHLLWLQCQPLICRPWLLLAAKGDYLEQSCHGGHQSISRKVYLCSLKRITFNIAMETIYTGWWFGCHDLFSYILGMIIPIDFLFFQRGGPTTNQIYRWFTFLKFWVSMIFFSVLNVYQRAGQFGTPLIKGWMTIKNTACIPKITKKNYHLFSVSRCTTMIFMFYVY